MSSAHYDLYFEVLRKKSHYFLDAKETNTVQDLKLMLKGILGLNPSACELWKLDDAGNKILLVDSKMLAESGFNPQNAKPQKPAVIGLLVKGEDLELEIASVSVPPPIPDQMRSEQQQQQPGAPPPEEE